MMEGKLALMKGKTALMETAWNDGGMMTAER